MPHQQGRRQPPLFSNKPNTINSACSGGKRVGVGANVGVFVGSGVEVGVDILVRVNNGLVGVSVDTGTGATIVGVVWGVLGTARLEQPVVTRNKLRRRKAEWTRESFDVIAPPIYG